MTANRKDACDGDCAGWANYRQRQRLKLAEASAASQGVLGEIAPFRRPGFDSVFADDFGKTAEKLLL